MRDVCCSNLGRVKSNISSVARWGGGSYSPPHWHAKYAKYPVFCTFETDFWTKNENSPPPHWHWQEERSQIWIPSGLRLFFGHQLILGKNTVQIQVNTFYLFIFDFTKFWAKNRPNSMCKLFQFSSTSPKQPYPLQISGYTPVKHSVANDFPTLQHFFERNSLCRKRYDTKTGAAHTYRCNTSSIQSWRLLFVFD